MGKWGVALSSALSMAGRAFAGAIPLALTAIASSRALPDGGTVASLVALAYLTAELADFQAQRDIARSHEGDAVGKALGYRVSVFLLIAPFTWAAAMAVARWDLALAFITAGLWTVLSNTYAGLALRERDFGTLAIGPTTGFVTTLVVALVIGKSMPGVAGYAIALHAGRAAELTVMIFRIGLVWPSRFSWRSEWLRTRKLLYASLAPSIVSRAMIPLAHLLVGPVASGVFSIGCQLLGAFALVPFSIATSAFPKTRGAATPAEAMARMRGELRLAIMASAIILVPLLAAGLWATHRFLDYREPWMFWVVGLSLGSGFLEPWTSFATAALHAAYRDHDLAVANAAGALLLAGMLWVCAWIFGPIGLGIGLAATRLLVVPLIWMPKTRE